MRPKQPPYIAWHPVFCHRLPEGHRFPMIKYELLPKQLLWEGVVEPGAFFTPEPLAESLLRGIHDKDYVDKLLSLSLSRKEIRRIGFPLNTGLIERELRIAQGTIEAAKAALVRGIGFNIAGGTHHAGTNWGEGFCMLNDQAVASGYLIRHLNINQILILDLDVHQGNGTADIFKNEPRVFTFSMHGQNNFPFKKEQSDWDVGLPDGTSGKEYLKTLSEKLEILPRRIRPEFVFFQSGADVLHTDKMGKLGLSIEDCRQRDRMVFEFCKKWELPVQVSMGGGYSGQVRHIVNVHCNTYKEGISKLLH